MTHEDPAPELHTAESDPRDRPTTWDDFHRRMSGIASEMVGAAGYLADNPEYATNERVVKAFRDYAERFTRVTPPEVP